jgi:multisubunit Na+/H+ antiporter MnhB subunit
VPATPEFVLLWVVAGACAMGAAWQAKFHRLAALTMLSVVGLALCITFAWFSAPDLALTQLAVEVVTLVLFLLGLRWMPKRVEQDDPRTATRAWWRRRRDLVLALAIGLGLSALSYALLTRQAPLSISPFFIEKALPEGGGTNVVNVMLVDFRAFDTLGEITVLGIVGSPCTRCCGASGRRWRRWTRPSSSAPAQATGADLIDRDGDGEHLPPYLEVPAVLVRLLLPVAGLFAFHLFMRGHNEPGGGFVAGLVVAIAFIAQYMVSGTRWVESRMHLLPHALDRRRPAGGAGHRAGLAGAGPSLPDHAHRPRALAAGGRGAPAHRGDLRPGRVRGGGRLHAAAADGPGAPVAARPPAQGWHRRRGRAADGSRDLDRHRRHGQRRRVAGAAAAHLPGADRPVAAVLRRQPVHLQRRQPGGRRASPSCGRRGGRPGALHRPAAAVAGADGHRHRLRDHGAVPGRAAGAARPVAAATMSTARRSGHDGLASPPDHLLVAPCCCRWPRRR